MIFTRLVLEDFGLFAGETVFDLAPERAGTERRNIVLFGGKNGSGKTTILEAVRVCLYGQRSRGVRVRRRDYEKYLRARIHRSPDPHDAPDRAAVTLEFEHVHAGVLSTYQVRREWRTTGLGLDESLTVSRNGEQLTEFDQEHWEEFVTELVPPGISQLFFFDGEKIQSLAEEDGKDSELSASIKSLLGLDLGERLTADLSVYARRIEKPSGADRNWVMGLERLEAQVADIETQLMRLRQERAQVTTRMGVVRKSIQEVEDRISREGGSFARQREQLLSARSRAEAELERAAVDTRELCGGLLPFALAPALMESLRTRLKEEQEQQATLAAEAVITERFPGVKRSLRKVLKENGIQGKDSTSLLQIIEQQIRESVAVRKDKAERLHPVSAESAARMISQVGQALAEIGPRVRELSKNYEKAARALSRAQAGLEMAPAEELVRPLLDELGSRHAELAELEEAGRQQNEVIKRLEGEQDALRRAIEKKQAQIANADDASSQLRMIARLQKALRVFSARVKERKLDQLRYHFRDCFAALARKDDLLRDVQIDPESFGVRFLDQAGRSLAKSDLSAGEKQIYAIAMLWALARVSGRPLPFLIDTPLGRLDSDHRGNLVENYFPSVAHQVVILSTDTEIDRAYFRQLRPSVARSYHLHYDGAAGATQVLGGYFWTGEELESTEVESPAA